MARRPIPPATFVSNTTKANTWAANQTYSDCVKLIFGSGADVSIFWKNACCSDTLRMHLGTVVDCQGGTGHVIIEGSAQVETLNAVNNAVCPVFQIAHSTTGTPTAGLGASTRWFVETSSAGAGQQIGQMGYLWTNITHACRTADFFIDVCQCQTQTRWLTFDTSTKEVQFGALHYLTIPSFTDANRGCAGTAGRLIYNTDDNALNLDNGSNWLLITGCST